MKRERNRDDRLQSIRFAIRKDDLCVVLKVHIMCTSGSVVEYRLAKARVAGSNPVSCSSEALQVTVKFFVVYVTQVHRKFLLNPIYEDSRNQKRETVTNSLPFQISNIICFQQFYIQWLIVVSSYFEQSQILQVLLPQAEEEYKQTSGSYLPSSPLSLLHPFSPVLPAAPLFPL